MENINEKQLLRLILDYSMLKASDNKRKSKKKAYNKRYYQRHREQILLKNKEMRDFYKEIKKNL